MHDRTAQRKKRPTKRERGIIHLPSLLTWMEHDRELADQPEPDTGREPEPPEATRRAA